VRVDVVSGARLDGHRDDPRRAHREPVLGLVLAGRLHLPGLVGGVEVAEQRLALWRTRDQVLGVVDIVLAGAVADAGEVRALGGSCDRHAEHVGALVLQPGEVDLVPPLLGAR